MTTELALRDYINILRRRLPVVAACLTATLVAAFLWSALQTPMYRSSANILINQSTANDIYDPVTGVPVNYADRVTANEVRLLQSQLVRTEAESRLGFEADIAAVAETRADFVVVSAVDADPTVAKTVAQTYAESYLDVRRNEFIAERLETAEKLLERIREIEGEIDDKIEEQGPTADTAREQSLRDDLADSYDRLTITADLGNNGSARIIDDAEVPDAPFSPQTSRNLALGGVLGLMLGAGFALMLENLDRSIKTREALESLTPGLPALAIIPAIKSEHAVVSLANPEGTESEVFRLLRAGIEFASVDKPLQVIQVTSAGPSAGKTTVAANLAVVMAQSGQRVAVVDADLRRPRLHKLFDLPQVPGISSVIIGTEKASAASHAMSLNNGRLRVFSSGPVPPGPSELLGSKRASSTFASLRNTLDVIIVDSPPVLPVSDALVLSRLVDATVLVANARLTKRDELERALEQLEQAGANVVGTVLNEVKARNGGVLGYGGYGYGYGQGYGNDETKSSRFGGKKNAAPRHAGTETIKSGELPRFEAARPFDRKTVATAPGDDREAERPRARPDHADAEAAEPAWAASTEDAEPAEPVESIGAKQAAGNPVVPASAGQAAGNPVVPASAGQAAGNPVVPASAGQAAGNPVVPASAGQAAGNPVVPASDGQAAAPAAATAKNGAEPPSPESPAIPETPPYRYEEPSVSRLTTADLAAIQADIALDGNVRRTSSIAAHAGSDDHRIDARLWADDVRLHSV